MKIHEYQAKEIFKDYGIPVPEGEVVSSPIAAELAARKLGCPVMVKAQIHAGGRGKGGGVKEAKSPDGAREIAFQILNKKLVTPQTPLEGVLVKELLIERKHQILKEFYLAIMNDRSRASPVLIASSHGGMSIEELARDYPEKIHKEFIEPLLGLQSFQKRKIAFALEREPSLVKALTDLISNLYRLFQEKDCSLVEINPLILDVNQQFLAADAKINFDDNALFRHPEIKELVDFSMEDPLEAEAIKYGVNYVRLDGNIGCLVNGAGLAMATMDTIKFLGGKPANFLDVGGGAKPEQIEIAFRILLADPKVKVVFINIFGGILRVDSLVLGLRLAMEKKDIKTPLIIRLEGDDVKEGIKLLRQSGLKFIQVKTMRAGALKAIRLAKGASNEHFSE